MQRRKGATRLHRDRVIVRVQGADLVHARQVKKDRVIAGKRDLPADKPGIAALGHNGDFGLCADADDFRDRFGAGGLYEKCGFPLIKTAMFTQEGGDIRRRVGKAPGSDGGADRVKRGAHATRR